MMAPDRPVAVCAHCVVLYLPPNQPGVGEEKSKRVTGKWVPSRVARRFMGLEEARGGPVLVVSFGGFGFSAQTKSRLVPARYSIGPKYAWRYASTNGNLIRHQGSSLAGLALRAAFFLASRRASALRSRLVE